MNLPEIPFCVGNPIVQGVRKVRWEFLSLVFHDAINLISAKTYLSPYSLAVW